MKKEGVIGLVHDISANNIADVVRLLRRLADEIERGGEVPRACIVITEFHQAAIDIQQLGKDCDDLRALGLLQLASGLLSGLISKDWQKDGPYEAG